ncbi:putative mitochondrial ATP-dependent RNA helicase Suv3 [Microthyrium microscopicum]|uniref:RNA helicase n=1 Tax=Microthyrium microscopicum TaxID=703497 RepID=A0A6A6UK57_9PEZI|nr:putative mitochondrial ATP-dependent RNA helicase Suv3 [Microthyrium microscopicum]
MSHLFTKKQVDRQSAITDCRYPMEWFPRARTLKRTIHLHVGPTNSGKTYNALKRLEAAERGCYAGPLRLLAQEVYSRLNAQGKPAFLVTGDDMQEPTAGEMKVGETCVSCTVEMIDYGQEYDVAVIDEVQMAANSHRGHAWTSAIVGVAAKEVHLCGEDRTVPVIEEIARSLGEELVIHRYKRLSPLAVMKNPLSSITEVQKGDCVVCFSVKRLHAMKQYVEKHTKKRCAIIYGSLPPEVRAQQARLFNDPDNEYDYLVASDAVGMGLNLAIGRMIFDTVSKRTREGLHPLTTPEIRQIGGRAGRYRTSAQVEPSTLPPTADTNSSSDSLYPAAPPPPEPSKIGLVTAFEPAALRRIRESMSTDPEPIKKIGIFPTNDMIETLCSYFPTGVPYSFILARILAVSQVSDRFFFCQLGETIQIADIIQHITDLSIADRIKICFAPVNVRTESLVELIKEMAWAISRQSGGGVLELKSLDFSVLDMEVKADRGYLSMLEDLHKGLVLYNWMSFRFPGVFTQRPLSQKAKGLVEENIDKCLSQWRHVDVDKSRVRTPNVAEPSIEDVVALSEKRLGMAKEEDGNEVVVAVADDGEQGEELMPEDDAEEYPELKEDLEAEELEEQRGESTEFGSIGKIEVSQDGLKAPNSRDNIVHP